MRSNTDLLRMVESWDDDPRGQVSPTTVADREFQKMNVAALKAKADRVLKSPKRTVVRYEYTTDADGKIHTEITVGEK